jgi:hypothetical protein
MLFQITFPKVNKRRVLKGLTFPKVNKRGAIKEGFKGNLGSPRRG